jgi:transposase InsO family protein/transposase-like protein
MFGDMGNTYIGMIVRYGKEPIMPWKESTVLDQRREFVNLALSEDANIRFLCRRFGISAKTGYKWLNRYGEGGASALHDCSRRPHNSPYRTAASMEQAVLAVREAHPAWGGRKIRAWLSEFGSCGNGRGHHPLPSPSTITAILHRSGAIDPVESSKHMPWQRFEAPVPNALWQMDFKGHFPLLNRLRCHPLTVVDDHSRYALGVDACAGETKEIVQPHLTRLFRTYGLPRCILCDNGQPWGTRDEYRYTKLSVWLIRLGIAVSHSRICHPETLGKNERFNQTLLTELISTKTFTDLDDCQRHFDQWRMLYNFERPHETLAMAVPASRYQPSPREFPDPLPPIQYNSCDIVRKVQEKGEISFRGRIFKVSKAFAGYPVALRPTSTDGLFNVYFCTQQISTINLNDKT